MLIKLKDGTNADRDLSALVECFAAYVPNAEQPIECKLTVELGDGTKDVGQTNGEFLLAINVGSQWRWEYTNLNTVLQDRAVLESQPFVVPANTSVAASVQSPNSADSDVDVTATLWMVSNSPIAVHGTVVDAGATATQFKGDNSLSASDDHYLNAWLWFLDGPNQGIARKIRDYTGTTRLFDFTTDIYPAAPDNGDRFVIMGNAAA